MSTQAIGITRDGRRSSQLWLCREAAGDFLLSSAQAEGIIDELVDLAHSEWIEVCEQARLSLPERADLWGREVLNPYIDHTQP